MGYQIFGAPKRKGRNARDSLRRTKEGIAARIAKNKTASKWKSAVEAEEKILRVQEHHGDD